MKRRLTVQEGAELSRVDRGDARGSGNGGGKGPGAEDPEAELARAGFGGVGKHGGLRERGRQPAGRDRVRQSTAARRRLRNTRAGMRRRDRRGS